MQGTTSTNLQLKGAVNTCTSHHDIYLINETLSGVKKVSRTTYNPEGMKQNLLLLAHRMIDIVNPFKVWHGLYSTWIHEESRTKLKNNPSHEKLTSWCRFSSRKLNNAWYRFQQKLRAHFEEDRVIVTVTSLTRNYVLHETK